MTYSAVKVCRRVVQWRLGGAGCLTPAKERKLGGAGSVTQAKGGGSVEGSLGGSLRVRRFCFALKMGLETDDWRQCMTDSIENRVIYIYTYRFPLVKDSGGWRHLIGSTDEM